MSKNRVNIVTFKSRIKSAAKSGEGRGEEAGQGRSPTAPVGREGTHHIQVAAHIHPPPQTLATQETDRLERRQKHHRLWPACPPLPDRVVSENRHSAAPQKGASAFHVGKTASLTGTKPYYSIRDCKPLLTVDILLPLTFKNGSFQSILGSYYRGIGTFYFQSTNIPWGLALLDPMFFTLDPPAFQRQSLPTGMPGRTGHPRIRQLTGLTPCSPPW